VSDDDPPGPVDAGEGQITQLSTIRGGKPDRIVDNPGDAAEMATGDLVRETLRATQGMVRPGLSAAGRAGSRRRRPTALDPGHGGGYSGPGPDQLDPAPAREVLTRLFAARGWAQPVNEARVFTDWPALVGREIAAHCEPVSLTGGELRLAAQSTAWATQLRLLSASLLARLVAELGPTVVTRLHISGPVAPSWSHGMRSVRGARGPRDTYG
jgi:predicted nucleic acid-binding Zn ribbon protein